MHHNKKVLLIAKKRYANFIDVDSRRKIWIIIDKFE